MYSSITGRQYALSAKPIKSGGEGSIYTISGNPGLVAKLYHPAMLSQELADKISAMYRNPPAQSVLSQMAWPIDLLYDSQRRFCGFVMKRLNITHELGDIYKYPPEELKGITLLHKLIIAQNICQVISSIHRAGYVFGDFNPMNIGVNIKDGTVAFFDTDTYHFKDPRTNHTHRCNVGCPGYVAPELLFSCKRFALANPSVHEVYAYAPLPTFTRETDNFALAIHIFRLLMNGFTPYNGVPQNSGASQPSPGLGDQAVERNSYCFKPGNKPMAVAMPEFTSLPKQVQALFTRAFGPGYSTPSARPSADEWYAALEDFEKNLKSCRNHVYYSGLSACPYCAADRRYQQILHPGTAGPSQPAHKKFKAPPVIQPAAAAGHRPAGTSCSAGGRTSAVGGGGTSARPAAARTTFRRRSGISWWSIFLGAIAALILFVFCSALFQHRSAPQSQKDTIESSSGSITVAVGQVVQLHIRSTFPDITANYNDKFIAVEWDSGRANGENYYLNITGVGTGSSTLKVYKTQAQDIIASIEVTVVPADGSGTSGGLPAGMVIDPIAEIPLDIPAIPDFSLAVDPLEATSRDGSIDFEGQTVQYTITPGLDGVYRFEFSNVPDGTDLNMRILTSGGTRLKYSYGIDNGDGLTASLTGGESYVVEVGHFCGYGNFTLNFGLQKGTVDLNAVTSVSDSIQYTDQENNYSFQPEVDGTYRFEFSNVPDGTDLTMLLYNSGWERIASAYSVDNGGGLTSSLSAGKTYYVRVRQSRKTGDYTLNIGRQKETTNVTGYTSVSDSVQFTDQRNHYAFTPDVDGIYRFELSDVPDGTDLSMFLSNSGWETVMSNYNIDNEEGLTAQLTAGSTYYVRVEQYRGVGGYTLNIGAQKEIADISGNPSVSDSIQFTGQQNRYLFTAPADGNYYFKLADVSEGTYYEMHALNTGWENLSSGYNMGSGESLDVKLTQGRSVYITVTQQKGFGVYTLIPAGG